MLLRKRQLLAKIEAVEGTTETLTLTEGGVLIYNPKIAFEMKTFERNPARSSLSALKPIPGQTKCTFTFQTELKGSGTAGTAPKYGPLLKSCGMAEAIVAATSVTYTPASASVPSLTMAIVSDGLKTTISGARGTVKGIGKIGEPYMLEFSFQGVFQGTVDQTSIAGITYDTPDPISFMGANILTLGAINPTFNSFNFDIGNTIAMRDNANSAKGYLSALITGRKGTFHIDPEAVAIATYDYFGNATAGTSQQISFALTGTAGNIATVTIPKAYITAISDDDRNGLYCVGVDGVMAQNSGDDEISIALT